jgi:sigma-B regulation protein RsbU (phosphoserine phosphatase)
MPDFFQYFVNNSFWAKGLSALVLLMYLRKIGKRPQIPGLADFQRLALLLLITDLALFILPQWWVFPVLQGLIVVFLHHRIASTEADPVNVSAWFWVLGAAVVGVGIAAPLLGWPAWVGVAGPAVMLVLWIALAVRLYAISEYNTEGPSLVLVYRRTLAQVMISFQILALVLGPWGAYLNPFVQMLLFPLANLVHTWVLTYWERSAENDRNRQLETLEKNLASLFEFMVAIGSAITEKLELDKVLDFVVRSAVKATGADGGAVFLVDEFEDVLRVKAVEGDFPPPYQVPPKVKLKIKDLANYFQSTPIPLKSTIVGECALSRQGIHIRDTRDDPRMATNSQFDQVYISSIILVPLMQGTKVFGVLAVVSRRGGYLFNADHYSQVRTFADYTSLTINSLFTYIQLLEKQEMEKEVGIAAEIQGQLLPSHLPRVTSVSLAAFSQPAKGVSGDYYDIINLRKGQLLLAVCDVAGKGIPASLVMVMIRTIIHLVAHQPGMTVSRILDIVNWGIAGKVSLDRFATLALISYDFAERRLEYSNAAHHPLLIFRAATKTFESLDTEGIPIGLEKKTKYAQLQTVLHPHDVVVLYTDGIIEAMNESGVQYSLESLERVIQAHGDFPPEKLKRAIIEDMNGFVGKAKQHDDQTFLLMKVDG